MNTRTLFAIPILATLTACGVAPDKDCPTHVEQYDAKRYDCGDNGDSEPEVPAPDPEPAREERAPEEPECIGCSYNRDDYPEVA